MVGIYENDNFSLYIGTPQNFLCFGEQGFFFLQFLYSLCLMHNEFKNKKEIILGLVLGMDQDFDELKHNIQSFFLLFNAI